VPSGFSRRTIDACSGLVSWYFVDEDVIESGGRLARELGHAHHRAQ